MYCKYLNQQSLTQSIIWSYHSSTDFFSLPIIKVSYSRHTLLEYQKNNSSSFLVFSFYVWGGRVEIGRLSIQKLEQKFLK